ncbi:peptide methionine sulfoxide reductase MsrA [Nonlabens tegetincola]|uniref:Peptide methionine sulfoxide reductase MsrA n=1 Tax=Nonlabens tegetincola TaxID=323273 RepID=A0A090Q3D3_9FLAO|nr:peptide-methionine (S)-S-oxide reductase MsrA [Nonlabens tegetincola]ARN71255.1 peptide-methionine (S)-S-oxide reductase [Nonlabens tegetincola]GAK97589.1 peptide methionine sulfoxide reductase MsrA [Nonlabens tegetincola]
MEEAIFAGGCFWCTEAVFQKLKGVEKVVSGFCGGHIKNPPYREVVQGRTGHAESILVSYDPDTIDYLTLLKIHMATHDPTTLNRQGYDVGEHYRSAVFYLDENQKQIAENYIEQLNNDGTYPDPIVTKVEPATDFYPAEDYHQDYYKNNREQGYCQVIIDPKIRKLKNQYSNLLADENN